jgi:EAL and modified HD-GYP domain-containing signal transduction protein
MNVYVARQPIFDRSGEVIAYELLYRETEQNFYNSTLQDSVATSILLLNSYLNFGMTLLTENKKGFINFGPHLIMDDIPLLLSKEKVVIELLESVVPSRELIIKIKQLKKAGYIIALDDYVSGYPYDNLLDLCDIIKVDFIANTEHQIRQICGELKAKNKILLAEKVETKEEFEWASRIGFEFFQGYFFAKPVVIMGKKIEGTAYNYIQILEELDMKVPNFNKISSIIESEASLAYKLLKLVNSSFSLIDNISSIQHCLSILGIDAFQKWFTLATIHQLGSGKPNEVLKMAMIRMRFMESIGDFSVFKQHVHALRLIGVLSVIDFLLDKPLIEILEELPISSQIKDTLLLKTTIYSNPFKLVLAYEKGDFESAKDFSTSINLDFQKFPGLYHDAVEWSEELYQFLSEN